MTRLLPLVTVVVLLVAAPASAAETLTDLLKQKLVKVQEIHDLTKSGFESGEIPFHKLAQARLDLLHAELDVAATKEERISKHEEIVADAVKLQKTLTELVKSGAIPSMTVKKYDVYVLERKIALERERAGK